MLTELRIKNFAIIEALALPLGPGLNVLTGETGAGKSIIVGALGLLVGERGTGDVVRSGSDRAVVEGVFDTSALPDLKTMLDARGIDVDDAAVVLRREVVATGRTRAWVNGTTVTATVLADIGRTLIDLHGQHEAQSLLDVDSQRAILDEFADSRNLHAAVGAAYDAQAVIKRQIDDLGKRRAEAAKRADYLRHVAREIEEAKLTEGEDVRLEEEARRLENAAEVRDSATELIGLLEDEETGALNRLSRASRALQHLQRFDSSLARLQEAFDAGYYSIESAAREIAAYAGDIDLDPRRLSVVRERRDLLFRLSKKYGPTIADVIAAGREARRELDLLDTAGLDLTALERQLDNAASALKTAAAALTTARKRGAAKLGDAVADVLSQLGIPDGRMAIRLAQLPEIGPHGAEDIEFQVALNVGHDMRPLARVASGGELSRVMLALKTILARQDRVPTLVFDEVDAGIGGRVGLQVGEQLQKVATTHQVFVITHLPQIAARAHRHILVTKGARSGVTTADVATLTDADRVGEIARMLGGDPESDTSRAHAAELLSVAGNRGGARPGRGRTLDDRASR